MRGALVGLVALVAVSWLAGCGGPPVKKAGPDKRATLHAQLGASYVQRRQYKVAMQELRTALEIDPDSAVAHFVMAVLQDRLGDTRAADRHFHRAVTLKPVYAEAQHEYGIFLCRQGRYREAFRRFNLALQNPLYRTPERVNLDAGECVLSRPQPDLDAAERYLRAALAIDPRLAPALLRMAEVRFRRGQFLSARAYLERYLAAAPANARALYWGVRIERAMGAADVAADYLKRLRRDFPASPEAKEFDRQERPSTS